MAAAYSCFWDTNILIDLLLQRDFEREAVNGLYLLAKTGKLKLCVSELVITMAIYVCRSTGVLLPLRHFLDVAEVLPVTRLTILRALESDFSDKEDAILYYLAVSHQIDYFITRDRKDFPQQLQSFTQVISPKEAQDKLR